jgi:RNA polymerase subunit RPABC4/transcription elongation factor Spt4
MRGEEIMREKKKTEKKAPCRYCGQEVPKNIRRCPYCGTLNPTVTVKDALYWTMGVILVIYGIGFFLKQ